MDSANEMGEIFVAEMTDFLKQGKSVDWILDRAETAFLLGRIDQAQLRRVEALVWEWE